MSEIKTAADYLIYIFNERKEKNPRYSLRAFARSLGVSSGQLSEILSGKRPLSHKLARRISIALALTDSEGQRLLQLVSQQSQFLDIASPHARQLSDEEIALMSIAQNLDTKSKLNLEIQASMQNGNDEAAFADMDQEIVLEVKKAIRNFRKKLKKVMESADKKAMSMMPTEKAM